MAYPISSIATLTKKENTIIKTIIRKTITNKSKKPFTKEYHSSSLFKS